MKLSKIKKDFFNDDYKAMAAAGGMSVPTLRNLISADREAEVLENGNFVLTSKKTVIFERPENGVAWAKAD